MMRVQVDGQSTVKRNNYPEFFSNCFTFLDRVRLIAVYVPYLFHSFQSNIMREVILDKVNG
jgi:hypothetical protein